MDDPLRGRRGFLEGVDVGHHVVPQALLVLRGPIEVDVVELRFHLPQRLGADPVESELALAAGKLEPEPAPQAELVCGREEAEHLGAGVAG